jgi:putative tryptophan/tyrosine transport system substrate-binding protein
MFDLRRRQFITLLGSAAAAWPLAANAQTKPTIGFLSSRTAADSAHLVAGFRQGVAASGSIEAKDAEIVFRWANGQFERLPSLAKELVARRVAVMVAAGGDLTALSAKAASTTIPIVFVIGGDPVKTGLVASINRPGGNITGVNLLTSGVETKRLELLRALLPTGTLIAVLGNPASPTAGTKLPELETAARRVNQPLLILNVSTEENLDQAFATLIERKAGGVLVTADPFFNTQRDRLVVLAARHAIPAIFDSREYAVGGGLMSYGANYTDTYRLAGIYAGRILGGAKPAELPVVQASRFELVINLRTAKTLGFELPPTVLALADEVIE